MENKSENNWSIQDYLSLGYLYLLSLGMFKNIIFYGFLGVNILSYSSVLDVLLSPFIELGRDLRMIGSFTFMIFLIYLGTKFLTKQFNKSIKKQHEKNGGKPEDIGEGLTELQSFLFFTALVVFGFFVGNGLGGGYKTKQKIQEGKIKISHQLTFTDGEKLPVKLLDSNSQYVFYVEENASQISISPIGGNIKKIEKIKVEDKKENKLSKQK